MTNGGDAAEQVVRLSLEGFEVAARLTGSAAKNVAILLASVLKQEATQANKTRGNGKRPPAPTVDRDPKQLITTLLDSSPVNVEATNELPYPNMAAFYNNEEQTLYVKRDVGDSVVVAQCVAQELGHAQLSINSDTYSRSDMGFQAVCIGYMLCKKYGIDTQNFAINRIPEKLAAKESKDIRFELSKMRNAMADIHSRVSDELYRKKQARSKEQER